MPPETYDVLIAGAGPAGSTAALAVLRARPGSSVLVVDPGALGRDKTCGDAVTAEVFDIAAELGVSGLADGYPPVSLMRLRGPAGRAAAHVPGHPTRIIPRSVFDARLRAAAEAAGARFTRDRVRSVGAGAGAGAVPRTVAVTGRVARWQARVVIGADGVHSAVRRSFGWAHHPADRTGIALRAYAPDMFGEQLLLGVSPGWPAYAWSFPIGDGRANIGFGVRLDQLPAGEPGWLRRRLHEILPGPAAELEEASVRTAHLPFVTGRVQQPDGPLVLAGDAAALVDPLTGEGIWYAIESGRLAGVAAGAALDSGTPRRAGTLMRRELRRRLGLHLALAGMAGSISGTRPALIDLVIDATAPDSRAFENLTRFSLAGGLPGPRLLARLGIAAVRR